MNSFSLGIAAISLASEIIALIVGYKVLKLGSDLAMSGLVHSKDKSNKSIGLVGLIVGATLVLLGLALLFCVVAIWTPIQIDDSSTPSPIEATNDASVNESPSDTGNDRVIRQDSISDRGDSE